MRRRREPVILRALRYRSGQAIALFLLSGIAVAACAFGPFYERAVETAQLRSTLSFASVADRGLSIRGGTTGSVDSLLPTAALLKFYDRPIKSTTLNVKFGQVNGTVVHRDGECAHVRIAAGVCPSTPGAVMASSSSAAALHLKVGSRVRITGAGLSQDPQASKPPKPLRLTVVGLYAPFDSADDYWFGHPYSTTAGVIQTGADRPGQAAGKVADAFFARDHFIEDLAAVLPQGEDSGLESADLALRLDRVGLDDVSALRRGVAELVAKDTTEVDGTLVQTQLQPYLLDQVMHGRHQARQIIPAFAGELALLVLVVVGIVVVAGAEERQQDFALARLRGNSAGRAARLFNREFGLLVLLSAVPGLLLGWVACAIASQVWLSGRADPELRWPVLAAAAGVTLIELLVVAWVGRRTASRPVADLLRRVPRRTSRRGVGAVEAGIAAGAVAGVVALRSGAHDNPLAVITPGLIALAAGLVLSRLLGGLAWLVGRSALWRGNLTVGLASLQVARRPGVRRAVILLCVAAALVVSAVDQWSVSARNRSVRAHVEAGAPVVLTTRAPSAAALIRAVSAADPSDRYATPVVRQDPPNGPAVFAVDPAAFGRIAGWGWPADRPSTGALTGLSPSLPPPITITGGTLQLRLSGLRLNRQFLPGDVVPRNPGPVFLVVRLTHGTSSTVVRLGPLPEELLDPTLTTTIPCAGGCQLTQIGVLRSTADTDTITLDAQIAGLAAGEPSALHPVALGAPGDWGSVAADASSAIGTDQTIGFTADSSTLQLHVVNSSATAQLQHLDVPIAVPALTAGAVGLSPDDRGYLSDNNIDGTSASFRPIGTLPMIPGAGGPALLVDQRLAMLTATSGLQGSSTEVWLGRDSPAREQALIAALGQQGVSVLHRDSAARHASALAASAPAWAMQLALVTAGLAVLIAVLVLVMSASTSARGRTYDGSAMALIGVRRSTLRAVALAEQLIGVLTAVVVGAAVGLVGAHLALPSIPIFVQDAPVPAVLLPTAWGRVTVAAVLTLAALAAVSTALAVALVRRLGPNRLVGGQQ